LTLTECFRVAEELVRLGCKELTFIGGEVFLFRGWEQIARSLSERGVVVNIMSNGFKIGREEIEQIRTARLSNVGISLDGTRAVHNLIRNHPRSFDNIRRSFAALNQAKVPIGVVTSLLEMNYPALRRLYRLLVRNGVTLWQIQLVNPMGYLSDRRDLILDRRHVPHLIRFIREKNRDRRMTVVAADNVGYYYDDTEARIRGNRFSLCYWSGCMAGLNSAFIDSVGNVKGCGALYDERFVEGNVRDRSLAEIWRDRASFAYNRRFTPDLLAGRCRGCEYGPVCRGGCRASNYFMTGSLYDNAFCPNGRCPGRPLVGSAGRGGATA
jgi:radical SAM protein with 4Fe4S-binding SPASM domain